MGDLKPCTDTCLALNIPSVGSVTTLSKQRRASYGLLCLELPRPWPAHIKENPIVASISEMVRSSTIDLKIQLVCRPETIEGIIHLVLVVGEYAHLGQLTSYKYLTTMDNLQQLVQEISVGNLNNQFMDKSMMDDREILICTHNERDTCCGTYGQALFDAANAINHPKVSIWATSHLGGHRMAATLIDLHNGRYWGNVDTEWLATVIGRKSMFRTDLIQHYRGTIAMNPSAQHLDLEGIARYGWEWLDSPLSQEIIDDEVALTSKIDRLSGKIRGKQVYHLDESSCSTAKEISLSVVELES